MIKFGTDGWRGIIGEDFTFNNVRIVTQAIADYLKSAKRRGHILLGYDSRFLSGKYAEVAAGVLAGNGLKVLLGGSPLPTPLVSFTIRDMKLHGGVMVTASHNPPIFNGIKFKADFGGSPDEKITNKIEGYLFKNDVRTIPLEEGRRKGLITAADDGIVDKYCKCLRSYLNMNAIRKSHIKILVDTMYGTGNGYIGRVLKGTNCRVDAIHQGYDVLFGGVNPEPIAKNLLYLSEVIQKGYYDIGIATDGDGDRIGAMTPEGRFINPHQILSLLLLHFIENRKWTGSVAKTISSTYLINKIASRYGIKLYETPVGFKHIADLMRKEDILIGGEESGGLGFKGYTYERDGILSGLLLIEMMSVRRKGIIEILKDVEKEFGRFCYEREDMEYPDKLKKRMVRVLKKNPPRKLSGKNVIELKSYDGIKFICEDDSWLLLRLSGTEPILRIYAEADSKEKVLGLIKAGKRLAFSV